MPRKRTKQQLKRDDSELSSAKVDPSTYEEKEESKASKSHKTKNKKQEHQSKDISSSDDEGNVDYPSDVESHRSEDEDISVDTRHHKRPYEIDFWKLPKKYSRLNKEETEQMKRIRRYFEDVIDKHELVVE